MNTIYPYIIDAIAVFITLFVIVRAYKAGLLRSVVLLVGYALSIAVALFLSRVIANFLYDSFVRDFVIGNINKVISANTNAKSIAAALPAILDIFPKSIVSAILANIGGEAGAVAFLEKKTGGVLATVGTTIADTVVQPIVFSLMQTVLCIVIFIFCIIIVKTIAKIFKGFYAIPILGTLNCLLGAVLGVIQAGVFLLLSGLIANAIVALTANSNSFINDNVLRSTFIFKYFYSFFA